MPAPRPWHAHVCPGMCVGGWGSESKEKGGFLLENKTSKHETHRRILYVSETPDHIHGCCRKLGESRKQLSGPPHKAPSAGLRSDGGFLGHGLLNVNHSSGTVSALPAPAVWTQHTGQPASLCRSAPQGAGAHSGCRLQRGLAQSAGSRERADSPGRGGLESARLASPTPPACPAADTDEHVRTGAPGSVCIYPHSHFVNQETGFRQGKSAKAGSRRRARASRLPCPGGPAGVASSDVSPTNPAPGNANGVNTCSGHIQEPSVCLVPAGAHPALCSLTTPPQHTHTCTHLCTPRLQSRRLDLFPVVQQQGDFPATRP